MLRFLRRNAIALTALLLATTGTGIAASRYIITSSSQIKPSVRGELLDQATAAAVAKKGSHAVVARARFSGEAPSVTMPGEGTVPLSGANWTQAGDEVDQILAGGVRLTAPGSGECPHAVGSAQGFISILLDGRGIAGTGIQTTEASRTVTVSLSFQGFNGNLNSLYEPGSATNHTLEARASDTCEGGTAHFVIRSISLDVLGFR
jgi:hypothetical protein